MRTLVKNKRRIYYQNVEKQDYEIVDGYNTGNIINVYSKPKEYYLMTSYPRGNKLLETAGFIDKYDKIGIDMIDSKTELKQNARIFFEKPSKDYDNWEYICEEVLESLNHRIYGLKKRV